MVHWFMHWLERETGSYVWEPKMFIVNQHPIKRIGEMCRENSGLNEQVLIFYAEVPNDLAAQFEGGDIDPASNHDEWLGIFSPDATD
jgi:hypothetical protein